MALIRAPELHGIGGWVNRSAPLTLSGVRGKVVVLHFWTFSNISCLRLLEELHPIEERFADEVVVIGVHSAKFPHEQDHAALQAAVTRNRITHPVLDDPERTTWQQYGIKRWPTLVVVDPEGYVVGGASGEGAGLIVEQTVAGLVVEHRSRGTLLVGSEPMIDRDDGTVGGESPLAFPGKVACDGEKRLAIADTGHDRVLVTDLAGRLEMALDGLSSPQGVRFDGHRLLVCDAGADRVVAFDLRQGDRQVVADDLASPWDVVVESPGTYLVAEAGRHRIWRVGPQGREVVAGTGAESLEDGPATEAVLAQPSGLAVTTSGTVFVDADSSALRILTDHARVVTLVGHGLLEWGRADGTRHVGRLQHPLGVAAAVGADVMYVADTFNSMLRVWEGQHEMLRGLPVDGLDEPGGLDVLPDGRLVVADTNNHRVVFVDPNSDAVTPLVVDESWLEAPEGEALWVGPGRPLQLGFQVDLRGDALDASDGPPVRVNVDAEPGTVLGDGPRQWQLSTAAGSVELTSGTPGEGLLTLEVEATTCAGDETHIRLARRRHHLTVRNDL